VGNRILLYSSCLAAWTSLPTNSGAILHLNDGTTGVPGLIARMATVTNGVEGVFRLQVANGPGPYVPFPRDLTTNVIYHIVTRYDVDSATTTLWIDATSEDADHVVATDILTPVPVVNVGLRQNIGMGTLLIDDLTVVASAQPHLDRLTVKDGHVQIDFTAGVGDDPTDLVVLQATSVSGPYTHAAAAITAQGHGAFVFVSATQPTLKPSP
jgi:hypothetical protein